MSSLMLYASPFAASMAVHLVLEHLGHDYDITWLERGPRRQIQGSEYAALNPKRRVPALRMTDGALHTEVASILYHLEPPSRQHLEWLSYLATELHQGVLGPLFDAEWPELSKSDVRERMLPPLLEVLAQRLAQQPFLVDGAPRGADAYLYWGLMLLTTANVSLAPSLVAYQERMTALPHTSRVLAVERRRYVEGA